MNQTRSYKAFQAISGVTLGVIRPFQFLLVTAAILISILFSDTSWSQSRIKDLGHMAIENAEVSITLNSANTGTMVARCLDCGDAGNNSISLTIDGESLAMINDNRSSFEDAQGINDAIKAVIYEPEAMRLVMLHIVTNN